MVLAGEWSFNEGSGTTAADTGPDGLTATAVPGWTPTGHSGAALLTSGSSAGARVALPAKYAFAGSGAAPLDAHSWMCWVYVTAWPGDEGQFLNGPRYGGNGRWHLNIQSNRRIGLWTGSAFINTTGTIALNEWHHVAITSEWLAGGGSLTGLSVYLDGALVGSQAGFPMTSGTTYLGGESGQAASGRIDAVRFYSNRLTQAQVQEAMALPVGGTPPLPSGRLILSGSNWVPSTSLVFPTVVPVEPSSGLRGWEVTPSNTGLAQHGLDGPSLPLYTGPEKPAANTTITEMRIQSGLDVSNGGITLQRCYIAPTSGAGSVVMGFDNNAVQPGGPVTVTDCLITGANLSAQDAAFSLGIQAHGTFTGNHITGLGSGIGVMGAGDTGNTRIEGNLVDGLVSWGDPATTGNHSDAFTVRDHSNAVVPSRRIDVVDNRFECRTDNATGACFIQTYSGDIDNLTIEGSLLGGGGYVFGLNTMNGNSVTGLAVLNNRMDPTGFGPVANDGTPIEQWVDNHLYNSGSVDSKGTLIPQP